MGLRFVFSGVALFSSLGCGIFTPEPEARLEEGAFELAKIDGDWLGPCCSSPDDSGRTIAGLLELAADGGGGTYTWHLTNAHVLSISGDETRTRVVEVLFSSGTYLIDGSSLTLIDSGTDEPIGGTFDGPVIDLSVGREYQFVRWLPAKGHYSLTTCRESGGETCSEVDTTGTTRTVVDGSLVVGLAHPGLYTFCLTHQHGAANGTAEENSALFSTGSYDGDARSIALSDAAGNVGPFEGVLLDDDKRLLLSSGNRRYEFERQLLMTLPPWGC